MILREIRLEHVKGIREAVYRPLSPRLNLFYGPNESGKSTLVEALHFGLFESSKGHAQHKESLRTFGGADAPVIVVRFEDDAGELWTVTKRFLIQPYTELEGRNTRLKDKAAEARLREILGTRAGNRMGVADHEKGIWPLLWVRQGEAGAAVKAALNDDARDRLGSTLAERTGLAAAGVRGKSVLDRARALAAEDWTPTGKPRAELQRVLTEAEAAETARAELEARWRQGRQAVDELVRARVGVADLEARRRKQKEAVEAARARAERARTLASELATAERDVRLAALAHEEAARAVEQRAVAVASLGRAAQEAKARQEALGRAVEARVAQEGAVRDARARRADAEEAAQRARAAARRARAAADAARAREALSEARAQLARAEAADAEVRRLEQALDGARIAASDVERLRQVAGAADTARAALEAAGARLRLTALAPLRVAGEPLEPGQVHEIVATDDVHLVLDGLLRLDLAPGAGGLDALRARVRAADDKLAEHARALGVASAAAAAAQAAEEQLERAREAERGARSASEHATREEARLRADVAGRPEAAALTEAADSAHAAWLAARSAHDLLRQRFEAEGGEDAEAAERAERRALEQLDERHRKLVQEEAALAARVAHSADEGLYEQLQEAEAAAHEASRQAAGAQRRADVRQRLVEALEAAWRRLQDRFAAPVREAVAASVGVLFPGSELALDEAGDVIGLSTAGVVETFDQLSGGAREQLGVLVRLGIAGVLAGEGRLPVIFDDALVNSDAVRRARMVEVLRRAAAGLQVLVLTCHDEDFDRLAADAVFAVTGRPSRSRA